MERSDDSTAVKQNALQGSLTWDGSRFKSRDHSEYAGHACTHVLGLAEGLCRLQCPDPVGDVVLSLSLTPTHIRNKQSNFIQKTRMNTTAMRHIRTVVLKKR